MNFFLIFVVSLCVIGVHSEPKDPRRLKAFGDYRSSEESFEASEEKPGNFDFLPRIWTGKKKKQQSYGAPPATYGAPSNSYGAPQQSYGAPAPSSSYGAPQQSYGAPQKGYGAPTKSKAPKHKQKKEKKPKGSYGAPPAQAYGAPPASYSPPAPSYEAPKKPKPAYGVPEKPKAAYGVPEKPKAAYGVPQKPKAPPPKPKPAYGVPQKPKAAYGAPQKPKAAYGAPQAQPQSYAPPLSYAPAPSHAPPPSKVPTVYIPAPKPALSHGALIIPSAPLQSNPYGTPSQEPKQLPVQPSYSKPVPPPASGPVGYQQEIITAPPAYSPPQQPAYPPQQPAYPPQQPAAAAPAYAPQLPLAVQSNYPEQQKPQQTASAGYQQQPYSSAPPAAGAYAQPPQTTPKQPAYPSGGDEPSAPQDYFSGFGGSQGSFPGFSDYEAPKTQSESPYSFGNFDAPKSRPAPQESFNSYDDGQGEFAPPSGFGGFPSIGSSFGQYNPFSDSHEGRSQYSSPEGPSPQEPQKDYYPQQEREQPPSAPRYPQEPSIVELPTAESPTVPPVPFFPQQNYPETTARSFAQTTFPAYPPATEPTLKPNPPASTYRPYFREEPATERAPQPQPQYPSPQEQPTEQPYFRDEPSTERASPPQPQYPSQNYEPQQPPVKAPPAKQSYLPPPSFSTGPQYNNNQGGNYAEQAPASKEEKGQGFSPPFGGIDSFFKDVPWATESDQNSGFGFFGRDFGNFGGQSYSASEPPAVRANEDSDEEIDQSVNPATEADVEEKVNDEGIQNESVEDEPQFGNKHVSEIIDFMDKLQDEQKVVPNTNNNFDAPVQDIQIAPIAEVSEQASEQPSVREEVFDEHLTNYGQAGIAQTEVEQKQAPILSAESYRNDFTSPASLDNPGNANYQFEPLSPNNYGLSPSQQSQNFDLNEPQQQTNFGLTDVPLPADNFGDLSNHQTGQQDPSAQQSDSDGNAWPAKYEKRRTKLKKRRTNAQAN